MFSMLQADAWEEPPQKQLVLKPTDITKALQKKWLQLYWPDDGKWWPCQVVFVDPRRKTANVLYETGVYVILCDGSLSRLFSVCSCLTCL